MNWRYMIVFVSKFEWRHPEADHHLAFGGRIEIHQPRLADRVG